MAGKRTRRIHIPGGRIDLRELAGRIARLMKQQGRLPKEVFGHLGMSKSDWSKKINNRGSSFTIMEVEEIAVFLKAPKGWPWIDDTSIELLARALGGDKAAPPETPSNPPEASQSGQPGKRTAGTKK